MQKMTLLEIVQSVLSTMNDDNISDISDTESSIQVVDIARTTFTELMSRADWPHLAKVIQLDGLSNTAQPNFMKVPNGVAEIQRIRYDCRKFGVTTPNFLEVEFMEDPNDFLELVYTRNLANPNVQTFYTDEGVPILTVNNLGPQYCTTFDDHILVFDSYDAAIDTTLVGSKSVVKALMEVTWTSSNSFVPNMPAREFPMYVEKVRLKAHEIIKQQGLRTATDDVRYGFNRLRRKHAIKKGFTKINYGRNSPHQTNISDREDK